MSQWLEMAFVSNEVSKATPPNHQEPPETHEATDAAPFKVVSGGLVVSKREAATTDSSAPESGEFPNDTSPAGRPVTWTGKVVSLAEWRAMSQWDRHGPEGRVWCGKSHNWTDPSKVQE